MINDKEKKMIQRYCIYPKIAVIALIISFIQCALIVPLEMIDDLVFHNKSKAASYNFNIKSTRDPKSKLRWISGLDWKKVNTEVLFHDTPKITENYSCKKQKLKDKHDVPSRFHGAFTGGFSAGYFNTVGSAEGFVPSNKRLEIGDYLDEEDYVNGIGVPTIVNTNPRI